jgi:hypothetical protein
MATNQKKEFNNNNYKVETKRIENIKEKKRCHINLEEKIFLLLLLLNLES